MGLDHYLYRADILPSDGFAAWVQDVRRVLDILPPAMIRGEYGGGEPAVTDELVAFNGNANYAVQYADDPVAIYRDAARLAAYPAAEEWNSDKAYPLHVARIYDQPYRITNEQGWLFSTVRTRQYPYDCAVTATLILFAHHLPDTGGVSSDYSYEDWRPGLTLAMEATGRNLYIPFYYRGWERPQALPADIFRAWRDDVARVIAVAGVPLAGPGGTGEPILTDDLVAFNGVGEDGEEPLHISREHDPEDGGHVWGDGQFIHSIRTMGSAGKRYDIVVAAALLLLAALFPQERIGTSGRVAVGSGGMGEEEWLPALQLAANATGRAMTLPPMWS